MIPVMPEAGVSTDRERDLGCTWCPTERAAEIAPRPPGLCRRPVVRHISRFCSGTMLTLLVVSQVFP
jgi:hypothetical protein